MTVVNLPSRWTLWFHSPTETSWDISSYQKIATLTSQRFLGRLLKNDQSNCREWYVFSVVTSILFGKTPKTVMGGAGLLKYTKNIFQTLG